MTESGNATQHLRDYNKMFTCVTTVCCWERRGCNCVVRQLNLIIVSHLGPVLLLLSAVLLSSPPVHSMHSGPVRVHTNPSVMRQHCHRPVAWSLPARPVWPNVKSLSTFVWFTFCSLFPFTSPGSHHCGQWASSLLQATVTIFSPSFCSWRANWSKSYVVTVELSLAKSCSCQLIFFTVKKNCFCS